MNKDCQIKFPEDSCAKDIDVCTESFPPTTTTTAPTGTTARVPRLVATANVTIPIRDNIVIPEGFFSIKRVSRKVILDQCQVVFDNPTPAPGGIPSGRLFGEGHLLKNIEYVTPIKTKSQSKYCDSDRYYDGGRYSDSGRYKDSGRYNDYGRYKDSGRYSDYGRYKDSGRYDDYGRYKDSGRYDDYGRYKDSRRYKDNGRYDYNGRYKDNDRHHDCDCHNHFEEECLAIRNAYRDLTAKVKFDFAVPVTFTGSIAPGLATNTEEAFIKDCHQPCDRGSIGESDCERVFRQVVTLNDPFKCNLRQYQLAEGFFNKSNCHHPRDRKLFDTVTEKLTLSLTVDIFQLQTLPI